MIRKAGQALMAAAFVLVMSAPVQAATYYVDSAAGNDANAGTSTSAPWKTIAKVNGRTYAAGDSILFKRGSTWREQLRVPSSGAAGSPITFGAYGTGNKPRLYGSVNRSATSDWTNESGSLWYASASVDVGNLIFGADASCGVKCRYKADVNTQGEFWFDTTNKRVYLYSSSNPATYYQAIECALCDITGDMTNTSIVRISARNYVTVRDFDIRYGGNLGIDIKRNSGNITIESCDISFIGGGYYPEPVRLGNGIEIWGDGHDTIVRYCRINQIYDAAITCQYDGTPTTPLVLKNILFQYNIIENAEYSLEYWFKDRNTTVISSCDNVRFENNVCINAGYGWAHTQRSDATGTHLMFFSSFAKMTNIFIRNNIFYGSKLSCLYRYSTTFTDWANVNLDYNCYYMSGGDSQMIHFPTANYSIATFGNYPSAQGKDSHSKAVNPQFVNPAGNYRLTSGSKCIDAGLDVGLTRDYDGQAVKSGAGVDIGAFEYVSTTVVPIAPPTNLRLQ